MDDWKKLVEFEVLGEPRPGGSKRAFYHKTLKKVMVTDAGKHAHKWRDRVAYFASLAYKKPPVKDPLKIHLIMKMPRPKYHYGTGKNAGKLKDSAPKFHTKMPDATKLLRSTEDALTGIIWHDDSQIVHQTVEKIYSETPGVFISVEYLKEDSKN